MRAITHAAAGTAGVVAVYAVLSGVSVPSFALLAAVAGSLLPDLDHPGSWFSRKATFIFKGSRFGIGITGVAFFLVGLYLSPACVGLGLLLVIMATLPHRGATHSLFGLFTAGALAWVFGGRLAAPFMIGYGTHLLADVLSGGIPLFWPSKTSFTLVRAKTGGILDCTCLLLCIGLVIYLFSDRFGLSLRR